MKFKSVNPPNNTLYSITDTYKKVINTECIYTDDHANDYKFLHHKQLMDYDNEVDLDNLFVVIEDEIPVGVILVYIDPFKPNEYFVLSKNLKEKLIEENDEDFPYLANTQFFFYIDESGIPHIRLSMNIQLGPNYRVLIEGSE